MTESEIADYRWQSLYRLGGVTALIIALLLIGEIVVYAVLPRPATAIEYFAIFHDNWLAGLLYFDLLGMISYLLFIPTILALYMALHHTSETAMIVATALFFIGIADFFATNTAFSVLTLSSQYATAKTEAERAMFLTAGQTMVTLFNENAFLVSYVIVSAAWAMISAVMLRSTLFSHSIAYAGILAGTTGIAAVILEHISASTLFIAIALYFVAIVSLFVWAVLVGRRLYQFRAIGTAFMKDR
jgi:hypothetical protein